MKNLLLSILFLPVICFGQSDPLLGVQKDSTLVIDSVMVVDTVMVGDSMTFDTSFAPANYFAYQYTLIDTIGDVEAGNYYVRVEVLDSAALVRNLHEKVKDYFDRVGEYEGMKINSLQGGAAYRRKAEEVFGTDSYRTEVMPQVRAEMAGSYVLRYGSEIVVVNLNPNGQARDAQNTLYFTHAPLSSTWSVVIDRQNGNETIQIFKVRGDLWVGDGSKGRFILRRRR